MRHKYLLAALLLAALSQQAQGQTTAWRPFRPGRVYTFAQVGVSGNTVSAHTLRVDSAYATASGDSIYTFNRLLRQPNTSVSLYRKSHNNLFGARLRWQPGTSNYYLETNAEPALNGASVPTVLLLRPRAAVGSSWAASTQPALTATLSSRIALGTSAADSLAIFTLSNGQQLTMSKYNGLSQGPQWLTLPAVGATKPSDWYQVIAPQAGLGAYDPRQLFAMQPGALLGYYLEDSPLMTPFGCGSGNLLRQILTRQQTADSLLITYQEQQRFTYSGAPYCGTPAGTVVSSIRRGRWAFSLRTGASPQFPMLALLSNEYRPIPTTTITQHLNAGNGYRLTTASNISQISYICWYNQGPSTGLYGPIIDTTNGIAFTTGLGPTASYDDFKFQQNFYCPGGSVCTLPPTFTALLPSRAAEAATVATLHPNPATDAATLTLATPILPGTTLALTDALGRCIWRTELVPGQTTIAVPLTGQASGLYLVHLATAHTTLTWKLHKQ
ncbi:MAG: T9SS type A sorting domain-containing protein [Hymenobacter sp.]|nr:MAG: T9SS type A sorting domain-containing protein [Hymenobacter sp.]